jgi:hypothetical protein
MSFAFWACQGLQDGQSSDPVREDVVKYEYKGGMVRVMVYAGDQFGHPERPVVRQRCDEGVGRYPQDAFLAARRWTAGQSKVMIRVETGIFHPEGPATAGGNGHEPLTEPGNDVDPPCEPVQKVRRGLAGFHAEGKDGPYLHRR